MESGEHQTHLSALEKREALLQKRQALEREIAAFKAEKEEEYKRFEEELNNSAETPHVASEATQAAFGGAATTEPSLDLLDQIETELPIDTAIPQLKAAWTSNDDEELQRVFGPSFLPLLEKVPDENDRPPAANQGLPRVDTSSPVHEAPYSQSATLPATRFLPASPTQPAPRPISASAPKEAPSHRRRSSTRSDISVSSLRSSIRDPQQPRSPKRVLFSIDNEVVSPSSSPLRERSSKGHPLPLRVRTVPQGLEADRSIANGTAREQHTSTSSRQHGIALGLARATAKEQRIISYSGLGATKPRHGLPMFTTGDDFENVSIEDDVFGFDEEVKTNKPTLSAKLDLEENFGTDEDHDDVEDITSSSPHAGSLPIEIKWPLRPDPRKG